MSFTDDSSGINIVEFMVYVGAIGRFNSPMNIEETWSLFRIFDRDSDGLISIQDFRDSLASFGDIITYDGAKDLICVGDTDGDGYLNQASQFWLSEH